MIEYTKGEADPEYIKLTSLLHFKDDTKQITVGQLDAAYKSIFGGSAQSADPKHYVLNLLFDAASECLHAKQGFNFENKIVLSIAIRLVAEEYMIKRIADDAFVAKINASQTGRLFVAFKQRFPGDEGAIEILQRVILMTPESIHLNSFMYEPILDMSDEHLRKLYESITELQ